MPGPDESPLAASLRAAVDGHLPHHLALPEHASREAWHADVDAAIACLAARVDGGDGALGQALAALPGAPVAASLAAWPGRVYLLGELLLSAADPGRINQGLKGTCAAACVETYVARRDPALYVDLALGLMTPDGRVTLPSGEEMLRDESTLRQDTGEGERSPVSRLVQVAFMEYAYPDLAYDNLRDAQVEADGDTRQGLDLAAFDRLLEAVTHARWDTLSPEYTSRLRAMYELLGQPTDGLPELARDGLDIVRRTVEAGDVCFVTLDVPHVLDPHRSGGGRAMHVALSHKVSVIGLEQGGARVIYDDPIDPTHPWYADVPTRVLDDEGRCSMTAADLRRIMVELSYKPAYLDLAGPVPAPDTKRKPGAA